MLPVPIRCVSFIYCVLQLQSKSHCRFYCTLCIRDQFANEVRHLTNSLHWFNDCMTVLRLSCQCYASVHLPIFLVAKANEIATPVGYFGQQLNFPRSSLRNRTTWVCCCNIYCFWHKLNNHMPTLLWSVCSICKLSTCNVSTSLV